MTQTIKSLVFFDMDGTLLSSESTIVPEVSQAMKQLKANGHIPVICTGRAAFEVRHFMKECDIDSIISMNGQYIEFQGRIIADQTIPAVICERALKYAQSRHDILGFYNHEEIALSDDQPLARQFYQDIASTFPKVNAAFFNDHQVNQLLVISHHADEGYEKTLPELACFITGDHSIDTVLKGGSKGAGIHKLLAETQLKVLTYGFGDGNNDITMFQTVDYGVAMANGNDAIKSLANYITDTNDNLGIVKGLEHYHLI